MSAQFEDDDAQIADEVLNVLRKTSPGKGTFPHYVTSYQILSRFPDAKRQAMIARYGVSGAGAGKNTSAALKIARVIDARLKGDVEVDHFDAGGLEFEIEDQGPVPAGYRVCALYRLRRPNPC